MLMAPAMLPTGTKDKREGLTCLILGWKPRTIMRGFCCPFMVFTCMMHVQSINL